MLGKVGIGSDYPVSIQSMTNTDTRDVEKTLQQINELKELGCEIVRVAVLDKEAADCLKRYLCSKPPAGGGRYSF